MGTSRAIVALLTVTLVRVAFAQSLPCQPNLATLLRRMPEMVHEGSFDMLRFSQAADSEMRDSSLPLPPIIHVAMSNLEDRDVLVHQYTLVVLSLLAGRPKAIDSFAKIMPKVNQLMVSDPDNVKVFALLTIENLGEKTPDTSVKAVLSVLKTDHAAEKLAPGATEVLMRIRPGDPEAEAAVIAAIRDGDVPATVHSRIVTAAGQRGVGGMVLSELKKLVGQSTDVQSRIAAISALEGVGPTAVRGSQGQLRQIANDQGESIQARNAARHALNTLQTQ